MTPSALKGVVLISSKRFARLRLKKGSDYHEDTVYAEQLRFEMRYDYTDIMFTRLR